MISKAKLFGLTLASFILFGSFSHAAENRWTHFGVRPLAMGNAYVSVADDFNALFYNPAGLARIQEWDGELLNPYLSAGSESFGLITEISSLGGASTAEYLSFFQDKTGRNMHFGAGVTPHLIFKNFGFGIGVNTGADITMHSDLNIDAKLGAEIVAPFTYAMNFFNDRLSVGATLKARIFAGVDENLDITMVESLAESSDDDTLFKTGTGVGADVGLLFTPTQKMSPTLGISITDLGGTKYQGSGDISAPEDVLASVNTGFSIMPYKTDFSFLRVSIEAHSINRPIHYSHKLHMGAEMGVSSIFKVQAGLKDGYLGGGFELDVGILSLRYANHVVDQGSIVGIDDELIDRRHMLQVKLLI
jgi:hypothetical protein